MPLNGRDDDPLAALSERERAVARMFAQGITYRSIGERLFIAPTTVRTHLAAIYRKLGVGSKLGLAQLVTASDVSPGQVNGAASHEAALPIVVLPLKNISGDAGQDYFANGITEDIITDLFKVSGLTVIGRNAIITLGGDISHEELGRRFNAAACLEGSVRRAGQRVRITVQLVSIPSGMTLWADRYDRELDDIFALQDEIAQSIVDELKVALLPHEKKAIETLPTHSVDAYDYCLQARHFYHLHTSAHVLLARRLFARAAEIDPHYARAQAGLADCAWFLFVNHDDGTTVEDIFTASERALALDPTLPEAHASHAMALHLQGNSGEAVAEFEHALRLDSGVFEVYYFYADVARTLGEREKAAHLWARAAELAPDDYRSPLMLSQMLWELGHNEASEQAIRAGLERAERAFAAHPEIALPLAMGAPGLAQLGEREQALDWISRALTVSPDDAHTQYNVACAYAMLGMADPALDLIERWAAQSNAETRKWLVDEAEFASLRGHSRFEALLA